MKNIYLLFIVGLILVTSSCSKEDVDVFSGDDAGVYFQYRSSWNLTGTEWYRDSTTYSFAAAAPTAKGAIISAIIKTIGKVVDYDRPVKIVVNPTGTTAIEGVHYEANLDTVKILAGQSEARVPIRFLRDEDLLKNTVRLAISLEENEHFKLLIEKYKNTNSYTGSGQMLSGTNFSFSISEKYTIPWYWQFFGDGFFGTWTAKKFVYVNEILDLSVDDWNRAGQSGAKVSYGRFSFLGRVLQKALQERANEGDPVLDEGGSHMQLGPENLVDYSNYE